MVKPLTFKGDKKLKKRKRHETEDGAGTESKPLVKSQRPSSDADAVVDDDTWVSADIATDVGGPVLLVMPSSPPSCIACDANGTVFLSTLENVIEGDPGTAEPHDVRQVWVASRVAGSEHTNFKGHHGRYLSCDRVGMLSAQREAVANDENFLCIAAADSGTGAGMFHLQTERDRFLTLSPGKKGGDEVRGDAEETGFNTTLRIRMQARFKPKLQASKEERAREKVSRRELETAVGRSLQDDEVKRLKKARREGNYHEAILDARVRNKHDKYS